MWYKKIGMFLKDWWGVVVSALAFIAGFFVGRRNLGRSDTDIDGLRRRIAELTEQLRDARETVQQLERANAELDADTAELAEQLRETEKIVRISEEYHTESGDDIEQLVGIRDRLESVLQQYQSKIGTHADN